PVVPIGPAFDGFHAALSPAKTVLAKPRFFKACRLTSRCAWRTSAEAGLAGATGAGAATLATLAADPESPLLPNIGSFFPPGEIPSSPGGWSGLKGLELPGGLPI